MRRCEIVAKIGGILVVASIPFLSSSGGTTSASILYTDGVVEAGAVQAAQPEGPTPPIPDPEVAVETDAAWCAKQFGVSLDEAKRRIRLQPAIGQAVERLEQSLGERVAGVWLENEGDYRLVVRVEGSEPPSPSATAALDSVPVPVELRLGADRSLSDLETIRAEVSAVAKSQFGSAASDIDVRTGSVKIILEPGALSATEALVVAEEFTRTVGAPVVVKVSRSPASDLHTYGGKQIGACTTAFTVSNYSSVTGVLTASHCDALPKGTQTYYETPSISYPAYFENHSHGSATDVEWRTTSHVEYAEFYDGVTGNRICRRR